MHGLDAIRDELVGTSSVRSRWLVDRQAPRVVTELAYQVVAIFGPTASGKSAVARRLADAIHTEVVSADALQVYRGLRILTNQPKEPTRLVRIRDLADSMSVGEYASLAHAAVDDVIRLHAAAVVAGGTGLYLRAALADLEVPPEVDPSERARLECLYDAFPDDAYRRLTELDPRAAASVHVNDRRRVVRALELAEAGSTLSPSDDRLWSGATRHRTLVVGLEVPKGVLDRRIAERADEMISAGVVDEVREALRRPISYTARKALGLDELATLPVEDARERLVARTRRYAAYQRKWMRRIPEVVLVDADGPTEQVANAILDLARAR